MKHNTYAMVNIGEYLLSFCIGRDQSPKMLIGSVNLKRHLSSFLKSYNTKFWQNVFNWKRRLEFLESYANSYTICTMKTHEWKSEIPRF